MSESKPQQSDGDEGSKLDTSMATTSTTVVIPAVSAEAQEIQTPPMTNQWQHGLCGCFDNIALCAITYCVPCVTYGEVAKVLGKNCLTHGILFAVPILNYFLWVGQRGELRQRRGIRGTTVNDCCTICWCTCCALTQEGQEAKHMEMEEIDRRAGTTTVVLPSNAQASGGTVNIVYQPPQNEAQQASFSGQTSPYPPQHAIQGDQLPPKEGQPLPPPTQQYQYPPQQTAQGSPLPPQKENPAYPQQQHVPSSQQEHQPSGGDAPPPYSYDV